MQREHLGNLALFLAVAEERSFTRAAAKLGISQSALSHAIQRLEAQLGLRLLTRSTRSVSATEAGERLIETLRPAIDDIDRKLAALSDLRERPAGSIRITTPEHAARSLLWPAVDELTSKYPDISVELFVDSGFNDIVAEKFDAGVRLGERLDKDMIAVRIGPQLTMAAVGSPAYFAKHRKPDTPHDLAGHNCINLRLASAGGLYTWEFEKGRRELNVKVSGNLVFNRVPLLLDAAAAGHGIALVIEDQAAKMLAEGSLVRVLEDWCGPFQGYHLYYPSRKQPTTAFNLFLDAVRYKD